MLKTFEQYSSTKSINEAQTDLYNKAAVISPESAYWQKAVDFYKKETGKDLFQIKWVFEDGNIENGIWPHWLVVAIFKNSTFFSKFSVFTSELETILNDGDLRYYTGVGSASTDLVGPADSLQNSRGLYKIWIDYFYMPIKKAIETKNFSAISLEGMKEFEDRMHIYTLDLDSDWKDLFRALRVSLETAAGIQTTTEQPAATQQAKPQQAAPAASSAPASKSADAAKQSSGGFKIPKFKK